MCQYCFQPILKIHACTINLVVITLVCSFFGGGRGGGGEIKLTGAFYHLHHFIDFPIDSSSTVKVLSCSPNNITLQINIYPPLKNPVFMVAELEYINNTITKKVRRKISTDSVQLNF